MWTEEHLKSEIRALEELLGTEKTRGEETDGSVEFIRQLLIHRKALLQQLFGAGNDPSTPARQDRRNRDQ